MILTDTDILDSYIFKSDVILILTTNQSMIER